MLKLPKSIKNKWVGALRSDKYKQGKRLLYDDSKDCYCVLGVLAIVCGYQKEELNCQFIITREMSKIPQEIFNVRSKFISLNDTKKMSFKWFASYIERYL